MTAAISVNKHSTDQARWLEPGARELEEALQSIWGAATGPGAAGSSAQVPGPDARLPSETLEGDQLNCAECL